MPRTSFEPFADRAGAGRRLADALVAAGVEADLVLAIPRGGVPVAAPIAHALHLPLDIIVARKIGAPPQPELAMGAATRFGVVWNDDVLALLALQPVARRRAQARAVDEVTRLERQLRDDVEPQPVAGRRVLIVDDGWATGATVAAAAQAVLRAGAARVIACAPVASVQAVERLQAAGAETVTLHTPANFQAVGQYYRRFDPVALDACVGLLRAP